jgi:hypothetical protein
VDEDQIMKKKSLWSAAVLFAMLVFAAIVLWLNADQDQGPVNTLSQTEAADGWLLVFDGETIKGWDVQGEVTVRDGLLILGGNQVASATTTESFEAFELRFDYRFESGQEGMLEMKRQGSGSHYGLGQLTPRPGVWNRATYTRGNGTTSLQCEPSRKPLFQLASLGPVRGAGGTGPIPVTFTVSFPGSKLALRSIKLKPLSKSDNKLEGRPNP